jgi:Transposase
VAREQGVSKHTIYAWKAKYGGMEVSEAEEVKHLRDENARLKKLVADGSNHIPTIAPNPAQGGASFATDVLIHPAGGTNSNPLGYTGLLPNGHGVSEACQLICSVQYQQFLGATGIRPADGSAPQQHYTVILNSSAIQ